MGSFGPGSYDAYVCIDFSGVGYTFDNPAEYGIWSPKEVKENLTEYSAWGVFLPLNYTTFLIAM